MSCHNKTKTEITVAFCTQDNEHSVIPTSQSNCCENYGRMPILSLSLARTLTGRLRRSRFGFTLFTTAAAALYCLLSAARCNYSSFLSWSVSDLKGYPQPPSDFDAVLSSSRTCNTKI